jgi:hypothetical protein
VHNGEQGPEEQSKPSALGLACPKNIDFGFQALSQAKIIDANREPTVRLLVEVEASTDFHNPPIVNPHFTVVELVFQLDIKKDIRFEQALLDFFQLRKRSANVRSFPA